MIGFATLPEQVHRKTVKRGFDFTLLVVGETGLGKSTLVNSLFLTELYKDRKVPPVDGELMYTYDSDYSAEEIFWKYHLFFQNINAIYKDLFAIIKQSNLVNNHRRVFPAFLLFYY